MVLDGRNAPTQVIDVVYPVNSVNPKLYKQGNTEPSMSQKLKACVETGRGISVKDKGTVRAYKKLYEPAGNSLASHNVRSNKTDHWVCPHGKALPSASVMGLVNCPNSVNFKSFRYENTEPSMNDKFKACVENIQAASVWKKICSELRGNLQNQPEMS